MKTVIKILLLAAVVASGYWLYSIIMTPVEFDQVKTAREKVIIERLKDIRKAQHAYKYAYKRYTPNMDSLINFVENDSLTYEIKFGSEDDSLDVALGRVRTEIVKLAVKDTIFNNQFVANNFKYVPFTDNKVEYIMGATDLTTESMVVIPVFEVRVPFKVYLTDLNQQLLINAIDADQTIGRYPGIKVGSLTQATNDAGNWE